MSMSMSMSNSSTESVDSLAGSFSSDSSWDNNEVLSAPSSLQRLYCPPEFSSPWVPSNNDSGVIAPQGFGNMSSFDSLYEAQYQPLGSHDGLPSQNFNAYNIMVQIPHYHSMGGFISPRQTTLYDNYNDQASGTSIGMGLKHEHFESPLSIYQPDSSYESSSYSSMHSSPQSSVSPCSSTVSTPSRSSRPSPMQELPEPVIKFEIPSSSAALQEAQGSTHTNSTRRQLKYARRRKIINAEEFHEQFPQTNLKRSGTRRHACSVPLCDARFERTEHVKRHEATVHNSPKFACEYCTAGHEKYFPKGRRDNYKDHLKRHINPNTTRTNYNPDAQVELDEMNSKAGKRTKKIALPHRSRTL